MKNEHYTRIGVKTTYFNLDENAMLSELEKKVNEWAKQMGENHPDFSYRILNGETPIINESRWGGQVLPPTIRFVVHIAYTI